MKELSVKFLVISILFAGSVFLFAFIAHEAIFEKDMVFDAEVFEFFNSRTTPALIQVMKILTFFGSTYFFIPAYLLLVGWFFINKRTRLAIDIANIAISSSALMFALKWIFHRSRPDLPLIKTLHTYSFPSGHALSSFIFCSVIVYLVWNSYVPKTFKWIISILLLLFSLGIGISRIVLRYHYASDVLAGFCLGIAWVALSLWLEGKISYGFAKK